LSLSFLRKGLNKTPCWKN